MLVKKIPFFPPHLIIHPSHCPIIVFHPQHPLPPPPTDYPNKRIACIVGDRVDLAICTWELVNDNDGHEDDDDEDDDAAVAADMEDDERRHRQPIYTIINLSSWRW